MTDHLLSAFRRHSMAAAANRNVQKALRDADHVVRVFVPGQKPAGTRALRGVPVFPYTGGICGTMSGTDPLQALLDKICDCGRRKQPDAQTCNACFDALHPPRRQAV